jgi:hypothetical protein
MMKEHFFSVELFFLIQTMAGKLLAWTFAMAGKLLAWTFVLSMRALHARFKSWGRKERKQEIEILHSGIYNSMNVEPSLLQKQ